MSNPFVEYFIKVWLQSVKEPKDFAVSKESWNRFRHSYQNDSQGIFLCETNDGRFIGINLAYVEMVHFLWQSPPFQWDKYEPHTWIHLHMVNREEESFAVDEAKDLADIVFLLETGATDWMPSFVDVDGEEVMFNPRRLVWFEACARYVQKGFKELEDEDGIES